MRSTIAVVLTIIIVAAAGSPLEAAGNGTAPGLHDNDVGAPPPREASLVGKLNARCSQRDAASCAMLKLISYVNRLLKKSRIDVGGGLQIEQTSAVQEDTSGRSGDEDDVPRGSDEEELTALLADKAWSFVRSRRLTWRVLPDADITVSTAPDHTLNFGMSIKPDAVFGTGRGKKKNNMGGILAAVVLKAGLLAGLAFKALVLLVGKAILVSKIALVLAIILWLKKLLSQERHVTYEVVAHPHHSHSHVVSGGHGGGGGGGGIEAHGGGGVGGGGDSYSSGWGRALDAHDLAYSAHLPAQ